MVVVPTLQQISQQHSSSYENYYRQVNPSGTGTIGVADAANFLKRSGLPEGTLHKIWELADQGKKGYLDKEGFYIALKLISLAQNGRDITLHNLVLPSKSPSMGDTPESPDILPSPVTLSEASWSVKAKEKLKYDGIFDSLNPVRGLLSGDKVKPILLNSKLPVDVLGKIWELADIDKDGSLDRDEFAVAMFLVYQSLNGEKAPPPTLPPELVPPSKRQSSFTLSLPSTGISTNNTIKSVSDDPFGNAFVPEKSISVSSSSSSSWVVSPSARAEYEKMFFKIDQDKDGLVSGFEAKEILIASGLSQAVLAHIWNLCDIRNSGTLNSEQFSLAMHLIASKKSGKELPQKLTPEMMPPSMRTGNDSFQDLSSIQLGSSSSDFSAIKELDKISTDIETLGREKINLQKEISEAEEAIRKRKAEIEDLHGELEKANRGLDVLNKQKQESQIQLDSLNQEHQKYEEDLREIQVKRDDETKLISQLKSKLALQTSAIKDQESELQKSRKELDALRKEEHNLEQQVAKNKKEIENLKNKIAQTKKESQQTQTKIDKLNEENTSLKDEITQLSTTIASTPVTANSSNTNGSASFTELNSLSDTFEARFKLQDDQISARATAGSSPVSSISGFSVGSGRVDEDNDDFKDTDPFKNKTDPFSGTDTETADPFSSDDPFKSDPFKSVSFAEDPFAGDPFQQSDPFKPISTSTGVSATNADSGTPMSSGNDPFSSLDPFGSGAFVTGNTKTKTQSPLPNSTDSSASDPFSSGSLFAPPASSTAPNETETTLKTKASSEEDPFSNDPFANKDPFSTSGLSDPFASATSTVKNDPFASSTATGSDLFSSKISKDTDPFSETGKTDPFSSSNSTRKDDPFSSGNDPFASTVTSADKGDPFSSSNDNSFFSSAVNEGGKDSTGDDPWFAFSDGGKIKESNEKFTSSKGGESEDQQLAWAKRESEREEEVRQKRLKEMKEREEMEIALALKQSVESSSDA